MVYTVFIRMYEAHYVYHYITYIYRERVYMYPYMIVYESIVILRVLVGSTYVSSGFCGNNTEITARPHVRKHFPERVRPEFPKYLFLR